MTDLLLVGNDYLVMKDWRDNFNGMVALKKRMCSIHDMKPLQACPLLVKQSYSVPSQHNTSLETMNTTETEGEK